MSNGVAKKDLLTWVEISLKNQNFADYEINLLGKTEKGDGYIGEIVFVKVIGTTKEKKKKELNLVIKHGKSSDHLRESMPVRNAFETEIHFYTKIIPAFNKLQEEHKVENFFDAVPKCYETLFLDKMEILIMDNLKERGFELYDKRRPLNLDHQKKVLAEYGKIHALSFALRDQKPNEFSALAVRPNVGRKFFADQSVRESFSNAVEQAIEVLEEKEEFSLIKKLRKILYKEAGEIIYDFLCEEIQEAVFTHGDCWNNNFMYKYENNDRTCPSKVMVLDWQISALRSPVFDLSHFIYATSSKEQMDKFEQLIEAYYASFSSFLRDLGSDPEELFPYSTLKTHWKKYSLYGLLFLPLILKFILCSQEETPQFEDLQEGENFGSMAGIDIQDKDLYYERLKPALTNYFDFKF